MRFHLLIASRDDLTAAPTPAPGFLRAVSRWEIVALSINGVVGSGVYLVLPVATAQLLGPASVWAIPAGGLVVLLIVLCFAEAGSRFDQPGGAYLYARAAFGDFAGFQVGWMTWLARVAAVASLTVFFGRVLAYFWPAAGSGPGLALTILLQLGLLTWINVVGVKAGARTTVVLTIGKLLPLLALVAAGLLEVSWDGVFPVPAPDSRNFGQAALLVLYAFIGFENSVVPAGETADPGRTIPRALITTIVATAFLYFVVQLAYVSVMPASEAVDAPLVAFALQVAGPAGGLLITAAALASVAGNLAGSLTSTPRVTFALANEGLLPRWFGSVSHRFRTPANSVLFMGLLGLVLALTGSFVWLAVVSTLARLFVYAASIAALPGAERRAGRSGGVGTFLLIGAALLVCLWAAFQSEWPAWRMLVILAMAGSLLYAFARIRRQ